LPLPTLVLHILMPTPVIRSSIQPEIAKILVQIAPEYREYVDEKGSIIVRLKKSLYGCKQSSANWYRHIKGSLIKMGYLPNLYDPCVFTRVTGDEASTILLYVDDLITGVGIKICSTNVGSGNFLSLLGDSAFDEDVLSFYGW
jgi:hypothetical protein